MFSTCKKPRITGAMMSIVLLTCGADSHRSHCHKLAVRSHAHNADTALLHAFHRGHKSVQGHSGCLWICRMHTDRFVTGSVRFTVKVSVVVAPTLTLADAGATVSPVTPTVSVPSSARYGRPTPLIFTVRVITSFEAMVLPSELSQPRKTSTVPLGYLIRNAQTSPESNN